MRRNMGSADRGIRLILAAVLSTLFFTGTVTGTLGILAIVVAGVFVLTTLIGFCPLYSILGISSCTTRNSA